MFRFNLRERLLLVLVLAAGISAQEYVTSDFGVSVDYSRFAVEGGVYLDVYLLIPRDAFEYKKTEGGWQADVILQTALLQDGEVPYGPDRWMRSFTVGDLSELESRQRIPDISKFYALPGNYTLLVDIVEASSRKRQRVEIPVELNAFPADLSVSDLTIASLITKATGENEFTRYGQDIVPNAELTFSNAAPMLYYFFEIYHLQGGGNYRLDLKVQTINGDVIEDLGDRKKSMPGTSAVEWGGFNTGGLKAGIYVLVAQVEDLVNGRSTNTRKRFYIYREDQGHTDTPLQNDYAGLDEAQLDEIYQLVSLIMTPEEGRLYESSAADGKQRVLSTVWVRRDPDPGSPGNEFKDAFYERVQLANSEFSMRTQNGWETDRGHILIRYGNPDNIERIASAINERPWERWEYYSLEGGIEFIFVDKTGFGDYELVHSTAQNETYDPGWERWLR